MATQKGRNWSSGDIVTAANLSSVERGVSAVSSLYEPTTWANGDTVTAAALNNIEQGIVNADGGGKTWVTLCEEEITTVVQENYNIAQLSYSQSISADTIRVTFDEVTYTCNIVHQSDNTYYYGGIGETGPDFSEYPFAIISENGSENRIVIETSGTHTIKIEALQESGSSDFSIAQVTVVNNGIQCAADIYNIFSAEGFEGFVSSVGIASNTTIVISAVLYKDYCDFYIDGFNGSMQTTGDASYEGDGLVIITGDCTITIFGELSGDDPIK